ncbi:uncharacterized protein E5676_scaffold86G00250 [Cucumis melo var. makuwa]|uniref:Uncharacterized protein n=1 Tax=Cucumis melo var. makuwa TaxID=1194695 RepID=A0A5A7SY26_CUCMM|nr:uncharacterized protein E6C27_scaffold338G00120 [Cucumis melo var. makuwa]TYK27607.1 uncharacterized protein E5676_scaffold86G00250 [Cucumis melo var. makuwa]
MSPIDQGHRACDREPGEFISQSLFIDSISLSFQSSLQTLLDSEKVTTQESTLCAPFLVVKEESDSVWWSESFMEELRSHHRKRKGPAKEFLRTTWSPSKVIKEDRLPLPLGGVDLILGIHWRRTLGVTKVDWKNFTLTIGVGEERYEGKLKEKRDDYSGVRDGRRVRGEVSEGQGESDTGVDCKPDSTKKKDEIERLMAKMLQAGPSHPWTLCQTGSISQEKEWELAFLP